MKIKVTNNTVIFNHNNKKIEVHPIWLTPNCQRYNGHDAAPKSNRTPPT